MTKELFKQYAELELQKRKIEEEQIILKQRLLDEMHNEKADEVKTEKGSFIIMKRKIWQYTIRVEELIETLKRTKAEEEAKGTATFETKETMAFYPIKKINNE